MKLIMNSKIIGPLNLINKEEHEQIEMKNNIPCILCEKMYEFYTQKDEYLAHLYLQHRLIIGDVDDISLLDEYLNYWNGRFSGTNTAEFCTTMLLNQLPDGTPSQNEVYYLLSDVLPEDYELRANICSKRLEQVLAKHQFERIDTNFNRGCLFCRDKIEPSTRYSFLEHLFNKHYLQLGKPTNLVFIDELIDLVEQKIENLICIFCEKVFKDRPTLKEHMRKKGHKRINPDNKNYDKFFLINYKNLKKENFSKEKKFKHFKTKSNSNMHKPKSLPSRVFQTDDSDSDWSDWEGEKQPLICLFCSSIETDFEKIKTHMLDKHEFNFDKNVENLNFYQKIKIVNYIRRSVHTLKCVSCESNFDTLSKLQSHLDEEKHYGIGEKIKWNQPEYFFPTYEDDGFLCYLEDTLDDDDYTKTEDIGAIVYPEETKVSINHDAEELSKETFLFHE